MNKLKRKLIPIAIAGIFLASIFIYVNLEEKSLESQTFEQSSVLPTKSYDEIVRNTITENPHANQIVSFCGVDGHCIVESLQDPSFLKELHYSMYRIRKRAIPQHSDPNQCWKKRELLILYYALVAEY